MYKQHDLVLLPTNEKTIVNSIVTRPSDNRMAIVNVLTKDDTQPSIHQHLYVLSDEKIKAGDWFIYENSILQASENTNYDSVWVTKPFIEGSLKVYTIVQSLCKKIIATTDTSLNFINCGKCNELGGKCKYEPKRCFGLPQIHESFIKHYVEQYNLGNNITKVNVEYEETKLNICKHCNKPIYIQYGRVNEGRWFHENAFLGSGCHVGEREQAEPLIESKLKVNSDNTINIKPITKYEDLYKAIDKIKEGNNGSAINFIERFINTQNDSWNREEVIKLILNASNDLTVHKRIEQNL